MEISETTFPARTYLVWRSEIDIANIADPQLWQRAFTQVHSTLQSQSIEAIGPGTALVFRWDEAAGKADLGIGNPVAPASAPDTSDLSLVPVAEARAAMTEVRGSYEQLPDAHAAMMAHLSGQGQQPGLVVEEYSLSQAETDDPSAWVTRLYYLYP